MYIKTQEKHAKLAQMTFSAEVTATLTFKQWSNYDTNRAITTASAYKSMRHKPTTCQLLAESAIVTLYNHVRKFSSSSTLRELAALKTAIRNSDKYQMLELLDRRFDSPDFWAWTVPRGETVDKHWIKVVRKEMAERDDLCLSMLNCYSQEVLKYMSLFL